MWYGYIYYLLTFFLFYFSLLFFFKIFLLSSVFKFNFSYEIYKIILSLITLLFITVFVYVYQAMLHSSNIAYFNLSFNDYVIEYVFSNEYFFKSYGGTQILLVYYFPFIYIFLFVTFLSIIFCLSYNYNEFSAFFFFCFLILMAGFLLFFTDSLIIFFFSYEMLLVPSFFILYKFAKTRRCIEAAYLMFFWTQFGALFLIFSFIYLMFVVGNSSFLMLSEYQLSSFEINFIFFCWIIGFGVKLPIWPFYGWLPKAHVEASTNFSIFLSGVLVKFAFFGLLKCMLSVQLEPTFIYVYPFLVIGITDSVFKLFYQIDLKKLVAYSTVVEMHWLTICVISGQSCLLLSSFCMLISHALLSSNSFLLVDSINRRFKTRLITEISGLNILCPKLFLMCLLNCLIFLGFPGSIFFVAEVLFFSYFFDMFPLLSVYFLIVLYLFCPTFFFRSWINVLFGLSTTINKTIPLDLSSKELGLFFSISFLMFWLGLSWQIFVF